MEPTRRDIIVVTKRIYLGDVRPHGSSDQLGGGVNKETLAIDD